jgi:hypothetical protein
VFFTTGVNLIPGPAGAFVGGLFTARDLIAYDTDPNLGCLGSNEAEMFYMPVPDPDSTLNRNYKSKATLARFVPGTLVHEFQHLINAGRRIYVNDAPSFEQVWLNEGLSHIAEELLYYVKTGTASRRNLNLEAVRAVGVDPFNAYMAQNFSRLLDYLDAPSAFSPFSLVDGLETRGSIWQLLRYAADQKGGDERALWQALVNTKTSGQANFSAVFGNIIDYARDWAVAQFVDDIDLNVPARYTNPSWNFRSIVPGFGLTRYPIATSQLIGGASLPLSLVGGGVAYVRFRIPANVGASVAASASGQAPLPANVELILVRTQ